MVTISKDSKNYSIEEFMEALNDNSKRYGVFIDLENAYLNYYYFYRNDVTWRKILVLYGMLDPSPSNIKKYLTDNKVNDLLLTTEKGEMSLSEESINTFVERLNSSNVPNKDEIRVVMLAYKDFKRAQYLTSSLRGDKNNFIDLTTLKLLSKDNHAMGCVHPTYVAQNTGRVGITEPNLAGISNDLISPIITVPEGFYLLNIDMGQVDPRLFIALILQDKTINYLVNLYDDAYIALLHYVNLSDMDLINGTGLEKKEVTEEMKQQRQKIKTLTNATIYGKNITDTDSLSIAFKNRLSNHPNRLKLVNKLKAELESGNTVFETYLGTRIDVSKTDDRSIAKYGNADPISYRLRKAINSQIQGLTADIHRHCYMKTKEFLKNNSEASMILTEVYDSLKIMVYKNDYQTVKDYLNECVAFRIDGYDLPVNCEAEWDFGCGKKEVFKSNV